MIEKASLHMISRLRKDADLSYLYTGLPTGKQGRPKIYDSKINLRNIDEKRFVCVEDNDDVAIYSLIVYAKGLKRKIKLVYVKLKERDTHLLYFSTDTELDALIILDYYKKRFQIEFLYRDGK